MTPRFQIRLVTDSDFSLLTQNLWEAFETPYQGLLRLFFPILNNDRQGSLQTCIAGQLEEFQQQQQQEEARLTWVKVVDTHADDCIAAAAKWYFYEKDPHTNTNTNTHTQEEGGEGESESQAVADWYPEGISRDFATKAFRQFERPREQMARRPHACKSLILTLTVYHLVIEKATLIKYIYVVLHIAFTMPAYRRQGLGHILMDWGLRITDELGLETWLDASEFGTGLYEKFGFRKILTNVVKPVPDRELSEEEKGEWEECERTLLPIAYTLMWRPPGGKFVEGETPVPMLK